MNGRGQRFVDAGYSIPKLCLPVGNKRLWEWAVDSASRLEGRRLYLIRREILDWFPWQHPKIMNGIIRPVDVETRGPLQTCQLFSQLIETTEDVLVCDGDSFLDADELNQTVGLFRPLQAHGGVTVRRTHDPECSYAAVDKEWWVSETREKEPFSPWSTTGPYWFRTGDLFLTAARKADHAGHISISPVYNYLNGKTKAVPVETFHHLGTPEAYESFKADYERIHGTD